jgi:hypothetical protein
LQGCWVSYRFSFNGQERDDEVAGVGNIMTAEFWEYDARLGRRWNVDPKPFSFISVYACFTNNPVLFTDITGAVIDGDKEKVEDVKKSSKSHIQSLNNRIKKLDERIENRKAKGKIIANEICEQRSLTREIAKYQQVLDEINTMEQDQTTQFYIITDNSRSAGETYHDGDLKQRVNIITTGSVEITAHELKHGFQYLAGETSYKRGGVNGGLNDINDEVEGYKRQALFGPLPFEGPINSTNVRIIWSGGKQPYLNLPEANLNKSSTVKQVFSGHNLPIPSGVNGNNLYKNYATGEYFK